MGLVFIILVHTETICHMNDNLYFLLSTCMNLKYK